MSTILESGAALEGLEISGASSGGETSVQYETSLVDSVARPVVPTARPSSIYGVVNHGGQVLPSTKPSWWQPKSRLDWFSAYTMRAVFLMLSFLTIGLFASSILLSF
jgi:hypothetical protein